jgi:hypothetical protein
MPARVITDAGEGGLGYVGIRNPGGPDVVQGVHRSPGNKNAALPMLAACLLTDEVVTLRNLPAIRDVETMLSHPGGPWGADFPQGASGRAMQQRHPQARA